MRHIRGELVEVLAQVPDQAVDTLSQSVFGAILVGAVFILGGATYVLWRSNTNKEQKIQQLYEKREEDITTLLEVTNSTNTTLKSFETTLKAALSERGT